MNRQQIERLFFDLKHAGEIAAAPHLVVVEKNIKGPGVGVRLTVSVENGAVVKAAFRAFGPPVVLAALEYLCRRLESQGQSFEPMGVKAWHEVFEVKMQSPDLVWVSTLYDEVCKTLQDCASSDPCH